ncbi:helix-turn-helix transcriptional regulator [Pseudomonas sp. EMN2]|uniref:helix-turn-helix domain-containing protein n=1 Tax=Pseudomonas sp. EMN2 TaxID=2615212 RepID=UPI00129A985F
MPPESFAEWLVRARSASRLSQSELGAKVGLAASAISRYESGEMRPRAATLLRIKAALQVVDVPPSLPGAECELEALVEEWMAKHSLAPQVASKILILKAARLL